jgi:phage terminase small subunit
MASTLTDRQRRFVEAFIGPAQGSASEAARIAGYANPYSNAHRLMELDGVLDAIRAYNDELHDEAIATAHELQAGLTKIFRGEDGGTVLEGPDGVLLDQDGNPRMRPTAPMVKIEAAKTIAKMRGLNAPDKQEVEHKGVQVVRVVLPDNGRGPKPE